MKATPAEVLIDALSRLVAGCRHVAVGNNSPLPAAAALLARARAGGDMRLSIQGSPRETFFTDGGRELFDCAGQGRLDAFFLGGGQIDGEANLNLVGIGDPARPAVRFPGSFGSAYLYFVVPRVILFREEHSLRVLVRRVDFTSAPGTSPPHVRRPGGPSHLVTGLGAFDFDRARRRFRLASVHPGHDAAELRAATGFDYDAPAEVPATASPGPDTLALIRGPIAEQVADAYPVFAEKLRAARSAAC